MFPVESAFKVFTDLNGDPLDNGYVYFGVENLNPITSPIAVYWDAAGTQPAAQPLRTINGYIVRSGTPANVFVGSNYSELVKNSHGVQIFYARTSSDFSIGSSFSGPSGSSLIGFTQAGLGAVTRTVQSKLRESASVLDFGAVGNGIADDSASFLAAHVAMPISAAIRVPPGSYNIGSTVSVTGRTFLLDGGTLINPGNLTGAKISSLNALAEAGANTDITSLANLSSINGGQLAGKRNKLLNGGFDIWQLGNSINISAHLQKCADRWNYDYNGTIGTLSISRYVFPIINVPIAGNTYFPKYGARLTMSVASSGNTFQDFSSQIESVNTLAGKQVTISFYGFSLSGATQIILKTEQYFGGGGSPSLPVFNTSAPINITGSWARYSATFFLASINSKVLGSNGDDTLNIILSLPINAAFDMLIAGVQIEEGPIATPFEVTSQPDTMAACQRYLQTSYDDGVPPGTVTTSGALAYTVPFAGNSLFSVQFKTPMRVIPAVAFYNPVTGANGTWDNGGVARSVVTNTLGTKNVSIQVTAGTTGSAIGHVVLQDPYY